MNHAPYTVPCLIVLALSGCNDESNNGNNDNSDNFGSSSSSLDGSWGGMIEDIDLNSYQILANVSGNSITRILINGAETGETALTTQLGSNLFSYSSNFGIVGQIATDPGNNYAILANEFWDFAVVEKGARAPFGSASIQDLSGEWSGQAYGIYGGGHYTYSTKSQCGSGTCVVTVNSTVTGESDEVILDFTGAQATYRVSHRENLFFDYDIMVGSNITGFGAIALSKDRQFMGLYGCLNDQSYVEECEFSVLTKD